MAQRKRKKVKGTLVWCTRHSQYEGKVNFTMSRGKFKGSCNDAVSEMHKERRNLSKSDPILGDQPRY